MQKIKKNKKIPEGTIRIKSKDLVPFVKTKKTWKKINSDISGILHIIHLYKKHDNFDVLIDKENNKFLKGGLKPDGGLWGSRITVLPDGRKLDKSFSLFSPELAIHDQTTNDHWDVIYKNPGGTFSYVYTLEKDEKTKRKKYKSVRNFETIYPVLIENVRKALYDEKDKMAVPMYTLLKTYMRIGNEIYFRAHGHKGLTTLKKKDVKISGKHVTFSYLAKNGVPVETKLTFPKKYIERLKDILLSKRKNDFIFTNPESSHPISEKQFKDAFRRYCGTEFYPHIVRSFYATKRAEDFLKNNKKPTKKEMRRLFRSIAEKLGHKKFSKNKGKWQESYTVTVNHYIRPELAEKIKEKAEKNKNYFMKLKKR